jgi:hypothetical protein
LIKSLPIIISVILLASIIVINQDAFALEQKQTTEKSYKDSRDGTKSWLYSITLPDGWSEKDDLPFYYASAETEGNPVIIGYNVYTKKTFASRDNLHSYLKSTEYLPIGQFGLGNSITTFDTKYGYKTIIQFKFQKQDGDQVMIRKDFHFMNKEGKLYSVQGFSSDMDSFKEIKKTLDNFKPVA